MTAKRQTRGGLSRSEALAWLDRRLNYERVPPVHGAFALARMRRLLAAVGSPHEEVPVVHVAGTKGKGSTVAMIADILNAAGHRVGRYLSPHVHALEERISVDGKPIDAVALTAAFARVIPVVEHFDRAAARRGTRGPSWFEVLTTVAFLHFARSKVDIAVLETGLGGRLDATNVSRPVLSVITSISLDHMALLGNTVAKIAAEKAGIIKRGVPVVSGATHPSARRVIRAVAARRRAPLLELGRRAERLAEAHLRDGRHALRHGVLHPLRLERRHHAERLVHLVAAPAFADFQRQHEARAALHAGGVDAHLAAPGHGHVRPLRVHPPADVVAETGWLLCESAAGGRRSSAPVYCEYAGGMRHVALGAGEGERHLAHARSACSEGYASAAACESKALQRTAGRIQY
jgi:folylpolyglutamate synthase/dihydropteroate synthase